MESRKMAQINSFAGQQWRDRHREQTYGHRGRGGRRGWDVWRSNRDTPITICKQRASGKLLEDAGRSDPVLSDNVEEWDGAGGAREIGDGGDICIPSLSHLDVWQKPTQYCKVIILQIKTNKFLKIKNNEEKYFKCHKFK